MNAEFQRRARRDKKIFVSDQWKEIEGNERMGQTRDLFKKIRDTKGRFHAKMGSINDRNCRDLTTEQLHFHFSFLCIGEGNGNPPQCSCLENPREGGAWWAAVYGVSQSQA